VLQHIKGPCDQAIWLLYQRSGFFMACNEQPLNGLRGLPTTCVHDEIRRHLDPAFDVLLRPLKSLHRSARTASGIGRACVTAVTNDKHEAHLQDSAAIACTHALRQLEDLVLCNGTSDAGCWNARCCPVSIKKITNEHRMHMRLACMWCPFGNKSGCTQHMTAVHFAEQHQAALHRIRPAHPQRSILVPSKHCLAAPPLCMRA
jgi:hypothetical protein